MESRRRLAAEAQRARWRLWALVADPAARRASSRSSPRPAARSSTSSGRTRRRPTSSTSARSSSSPGEIRIRVTNPQQRRPDDRLGHGRRRDRPVHARRRRDARPAALEHDRRPLRLGRGRADLGRRDELDRDRDDEGDRRRGRDAGARRREASSATASIGLLVGIVPVALGLLWLPSLRRARAAVARGVHGADGRACSRSSPSRRSAEALDLQAALPSGLGGAGLVLLGVATS